MLLPSTTTQFMMDLLVHADASLALRTIHDHRGPCVDLCYVDPPFNVGARFTARTKPTERRSHSIRDGGPVAYDDRWGGVDGLLKALEPVVILIQQVLTPTGLLWLHLDHRAVHEAKVMCERIFGRGCFRGEIIWVPGNGSRGRRGPSITHQNLLVFCNSASPKAELVWNSDHPDLREPFADTSLSMHFQQIDEHGRRFRDRVVGGKTYRYYADEGRRLGSVWTDIPAMRANTPLMREGTGYPTQKPERLLERIVRLCSNPGQLVCDPMCGSGTTLLAAARLGRRFVGSDSSPIAFDLATARLRGEGIAFDTRLPTAGER